MGSSSGARWSRSCAAPLVGLPRGVERREVERQVQLVVVAVVRRHQPGVEQVHLADHHPVARDSRRAAAQRPEVRVGLGSVVERRCGGCRRSRAGRRGSSGSLPMRWTTSMRKPSTPRSSQKRNDVVHGRRRPRGSPSSGRAARAGTGAGSTGRSRRRRSTPGRSLERGDPVVGRPTVGAGIAPDVPVALGVAVVTTGMPGTTGAGRRCGWGPRSRMTRMPAVVGVGHEGVEVVEVVPKTGSTSQ